MTKNSSAEVTPPASEAPPEPAISLSVFLEGKEVTPAQGTVLAAMYPSRKLTRAAWLELASSEMQREVR